MEEFELAVTGMDCPACARRLERSLATVVGVRRVSADHAANRVRVVLDQVGTEHAVRVGIVAAGFEVK